MSNKLLPDVILASALCTEPADSEVFTKQGLPINTSGCLIKSNKYWLKNVLCYLNFLAIYIYIYLFYHIASRSRVGWYMNGALNSKALVHCWLIEWRYLTDSPQQVTEFGIECLVFYSRQAKSENQKFSEQGILLIGNFTANWTCNGLFFLLLLDAR